MRFVCGKLFSGWCALMAQWCARLGVLSGARRRVREVMHAAACAGGGARGGDMRQCLRDGVRKAVRGARVTTTCDGKRAAGGNAGPTL